MYFSRAGAKKSIFDGSASHLMVRIFEDLMIPMEGSDNFLRVRGF